MPHFLDIDLLESLDLRRMIDLAIALKKGEAKLPSPAPLAGKTLAMIFEKPSTRTRVSFEMAMRQLGGDALFLSRNDIQLGRGEEVPDTARVLSRYISAIMIRATHHQHLLDMAEFATVPVINGLTERSHPCQIMADIMTIEEKLGDIAGKTLAWIGDGNNVASSLIHAAVKFGFELRFAVPQKYAPKRHLLSWAAANGGKVKVFERPEDAVAGADAVFTDVWVSMGDFDPDAKRMALRSYQVNERLMKLAKPEAIFLHCLPAHRGEEVADEVIDGPQSVVFDEAENRLHAQKAILLWCFGVI